MPINLEKLLTLSKHSLPAITVITGDEYFLIEQALKSLCHFAKAQGYTEKEVFHVDTVEQWSRAWQSIASQSLFADKKMILLRSTSATLAQSVQHKVEQYCQQPDPATRIVWIMPRLKSTQLKQAWLKAVEKTGVIVQAWPISREQLPSWIKSRLQKKGLAMTESALTWFCEQIAGDSSAAAQEIEKLYCLYGLNKDDTSPLAILTLEHLQHAVVGNARSDVYMLIDSCLQGNGERTLTLFNMLKEQHSELVLVNWAITRSLRQLLALHAAPSAQFSATCTAQGIWPKQHNDFRSACRRLTVADCHQLLMASQQLDETIKGIHSDDPWQGLQHLCLQFAGLSGLPQITVR